MGGWGRGQVTLFFLQISFSQVQKSFHFEFHSPGLPGTGQKVCGGVGGGCVNRFQC